MFEIISIRKFSVFYIFIIYILCCAWYLVLGIYIYIFIGIVEVESDGE